MRLLASLLFTVPAVSALHSSGLLVPTIYDLQQQQQDDKLQISPTYHEHNFSVPVDHFHNDTRYAPHSNDFFPLRYWFDASHYQPGGPVFVIAAGETDAADRLPFLAQGVVAQLAVAYHGIGVVLEHRYYGTSFPVANLSTESLRFLSTDQAMADYAYFAQNVVFPGFEALDLTAETTPWIAYGGSYAGAFVAFLRMLYPQTFWGAVSTSGVTRAIVDYWQYMEPIRLFAPADCVASTQTLVNVVDEILIAHAANKTLKTQLKSAFALSDVRDDADFTNILTYGVNSFQGRNWDPAVGDATFAQYCRNITSPHGLYPDDHELRSSVVQLVSASGYDGRNDSLVTNMLNWIGFIKTSMGSADGDRMARLSTARGNPDLFFSSSAPPRSLKDYTWLSWPYQVCTEWGYFITGSSVPADTLPLISRLLDLPYTSQLCSMLFDITERPDVDAINKHGGWNFSYPRVAIIDGLADPWRPATPHADVAPSRVSTDEEPFILIDIPAEEVWDGIRGAVHHWDQNGLSATEVAQGKRPPRPIVHVQKEVVRFVGVWLEKWKKRAATWEKRDQWVFS